MASDKGGVRCEHCNHTPVDHVRIVKLGACKSPGGCDCDEYLSEETNSYTDCQYCGCAAFVHEGAEILRKPKKDVASAAAGTVSGGGAGFPSSSMAFQPRTSTEGVPVQDMTFGTCKRSGCTFPRRVEGDRVHDYCSRTCARKDSSMQQQQQQQQPTSSGLGSTSALVAAAMSSMFGQGPHPPPPHMTCGSGTGVSPGPGVPGAPPGAPSSAPPGGPPPSGPVGSTKTCSKCGTQPANPGRTWCQKCYVDHVTKTSS